MVLSDGSPNFSILNLEKKSRDSVIIIHVFMRESKSINLRWHSNLRGVAMACYKVDNGKGKLIKKGYLPKQMNFFNHAPSSGFDFKYEIHLKMNSNKKTKPGYVAFEAVTNEDPAIASALSVGK
jgi:hypothetical protein